MFDAPKQPYFFWYRAATSIIEKSGVKLTNMYIWTRYMTTILMIQHTTTVYCCTWYSSLLREMTENHLFLLRTWHGSYGKNRGWKTSTSISISKFSYHTYESMINSGNTSTKSKKSGHDHKEDGRVSGIQGATRTDHVKMIPDKKCWSTTWSL